MTLRVILVCGQYPTATRWGGIGTYTRHHARALRDAGVQVHVLSGATPDAPRLDDDGGIAVHRTVPTTGGDAGIERVRLAALLSELVGQVGADVVEGPEYAAPLLEFQRGMPRVPVVIRLHGAATLVRGAAQPQWRATLAQLSPVSRVLEASERESVARATLVSSPTRWTLDALRARGWALGASPLQVFNPFTLDGADGGAVRAQETVVIPGRLDRIKGADLLPEVMQRVWERRPDAHFVSIGQDSARTERETWGAWIRRMLPTERQHLVTLLGGRPPAQVDALLADQRIALFASVFETFSYTLVECMAKGLACVVASGGGARELADHGTHLLLAPRSAPAIADTLVQLLSQPGTVDVLGQAAAAHVRDVLTAPAITDRVVSAYAQLALARAKAVA